MGKGNTQDGSDGLDFDLEARLWATADKANSNQIGNTVDDAIGAIECENATLEGMLPRNCTPNRPDKALRVAGKGHLCLM